MEGKAVSALRSKRGLRRENGAEPPVVGLTSQTTNEWKANTMKPYILRDAQPVEPQTATRSPRPKPEAPVTAAGLLPRPSATINGPGLFIGLNGAETDRVRARPCRRRSNAGRHGGASGVESGNGRKS